MRRAFAAVMRIRYAIFPASHPEPGSPVFPDDFRRICAIGEANLFEYAAPGKWAKMHDDTPHNVEQLFPSEDMVSASELREFLFCERAWFLSRQGHRVSAQAEAQRAEGIVFHEATAGAASRGSSPWVFWLAAILAGAGIAILLLQIWQGRQ
jgi:hypothetical protein